MQIGVRMGHIPASRHTVTMAIAVIAVITLSIAMLCGCGTARNTNQATDSGSGGNRLASSLQAYATQLLGQDSGMDPAQKATLRKAATSGKISLSDYKAAWSRYITCVQDKGHPRPTLKTYSNGIQQPQGDVLPSDKADDLDYIQKKAKDLNACGIATVDSVDALYMAQVGNPNLYASHEEGAVDCLKRAGLVPKSYTVEQYEKEANAMGHAAPGETVNTTYDMKKPEVLACLAANGNVFMDR